MGVLRFDGADWLRFTSLATPLALTSDGAWTSAVLLKQAVDSGIQAYSYLCDATPTAVAGVGRTAAGLIYTDVAGSGQVGQDIVGTSDTFIVVASKSSGTTQLAFNLYSRSTGTWATPDTQGAHANQAAATMWEIATWQGGGDLANAWLGLAAFWEGQMSQTNVEHLDDNWRTSDWFQNPHGNPTGLVEMNAEAINLSDLMGNATDIAVTGSPSLDPSETLDGFLFNGDGAGPDLGTDLPPAGRFTPGLFPEGG